MNLFSDGIFSFTFGGKTFSYPKPQPESDFIFADETNPIRVVNQFLMAFVNASEKTIAFSAVDLKFTSENPILSPLHRIDYETIRLRLRTLFAAKGESITLEKLSIQYLKSI